MRRACEACGADAEMVRGGIPATAALVARALELAERALRPGGPKVMVYTDVLELKGILRALGERVSGVER